MAPYFTKMLHVRDTGVTTLFVMSGFLIFYRYAPKFCTTGFSNYNYFVNRIGRIFPLYLILTVITLVFTGQNDFRIWVLNVTLLKGYFNLEKFSGLIQTWSLTIEESFYFLAPFLFIGFKRYGFGISLVAIITGYGLVLLSNMFGFTSLMSTPGLMLNFTIFGKAFAFYCGYLIYNQVLKGRTKLGVPVFTIGGGLAVISFAALSVFLKPYFVQFPDTASLIWFDLVLPICICLLLLGLITERSQFQSLLSSSFFQLLGKSSYSFFLIHAGIYYEFLYFKLSKNNLLIFLVLNILALGLYRFVEEPLNQLIRRKLKKNLKAAIPEQDLIRN